MSKETYDLFEEEERHIAVALDQVQRALDQYIAQKKSLPIIDHDPYRKVSFFKLEQLNLIQERPEIDFFITDQEYLVTTKKASVICTGLLNYMERMLMPERLNSPTRSLHV